MSNETEHQPQSLIEEPGDLGRRIRYWRGRCGLSRAELARRSGINDGYLEYLETRPMSVPELRTVTRIANVVGTTVAELLGGNADRLGGRAPAARHPSLVPLSSDRCWARLGSSGIGRIVFDLADGPIALPANFAVKDGSIFLRTQGGSPIDRVRSDAPISLEVDRIDEAMSSGWSVLVRGTCEHLGVSCDIASVFGVQVDPWAGGRRESWLRLRPVAITGREIEVIV